MQGDLSGLRVHLCGQFTYILKSVTFFFAMNLNTSGFWNIASAVGGGERNGMWQSGGLGQSPDLLVSALPRVSTETFTLPPQRASGQEHPAEGGRLPAQAPHPKRAPSTLPARTSVVTAPVVNNEE